jgi:hypothetical protein
MWYQTSIDRHFPFGMCLKPLQARNVAYFNHMRPSACLAHRNFSHSSFCGPSFWIPFVGFTPLQAPWLGLVPVVRRPFWKPQSSSSIRCQVAADRESLIRPYAGHGLALSAYPRRYTEFNYASDATRVGGAHRKHFEDPQIPHQTGYYPRAVERVHGKEKQTRHKVQTQAVKEVAFE